MATWLAGRREIYSFSNTCARSNHLLHGIRTVEKRREEESVDWSIGFMNVPGTNRLRCLGVSCIVVDESAMCRSAQNDYILILACPKGAKRELMRISGFRSIDYAVCALGYNLNKRDCNLRSQVGLQRLSMLDRVTLAPSVSSAIPSYTTIDIIADFVKGRGDEWVYLPEGGTMAAASLGLRSGSYGSLHQQLQDGAFPATQPILLRRAARSFSGVREREKVLPRIYKFVGRRKVGILLMLMISAALLSFVSVISRACPVCYIPSVYSSISFANGRKPGQGTGFNIDDDILLEMEECYNVVVASAIFGNYDLMQQPKNISDHTKKNACFYMFIDEKTEAYMRNSSGLDDSKRVGLWRVVLVRNLPYEDSRRNGKVPKLLLHRLFPNAQFSIWIDGKLQLVVDPYQILERFLWRENYTFAISRHYRRFDVFEEAEANKAAGKYDNASIDYQIEFYKKEGLIPYSLSKLPITSDVPEGCVIIREHIPITDLFTCLWFNEVDRFTSRDQISFSTVRDKIMSQVDWTINMFMDCERRNFVVQAYHRDLLEQRKALAAMHHPVHPPPAAVTRDKDTKAPPLRKLPGKTPARRGRDKRSSSRRRHPRVIGGNL
ncbi:hypothetical protein ZIOFF_072302 [Zingiber officinale]|uniref:TOD1/MUCI70 glycosyltransferase-like domain-containing protein n=1 Tax=Zingiber officinale TaxID=94328 RepID=A0A8J5CVB3_ZINOF|nr:hypothetical protein ZIOFF_072302 [Zingiber officinale]